MRDRRTHEEDGSAHFQETQSSPFVGRLAPARLGCTDLPLTIVRGPRLQRTTGGERGYRWSYYNFRSRARNRGPLSLGGNYKSDLRCMDYGGTSRLGV